MSTTHTLLSPRVLLISVSLFIGLFVLSAKGATTYQTTIAECQKRTGLGVGLCKTLIKQNLNVDSCKKRTGLSATDCAKRIEEIKNDPEFSGVPAPVPRSDASDARATALTAPVAVQPEDSMAELRTKKERALTELQAKTKTVILFLKERGAEVSDLEASFGELEKKSDELLSAYNVLQDVYRSTAQVPMNTRQEMRSEAKGKVESLRKAFVEYYQSDILATLLATRKQIL